MLLDYLHDGTTIWCYWICSKLYGDGSGGWINAGAILGISSVNTILNGFTVSAMLNAVDVDLRYNSVTDTLITCS